MDRSEPEWADWTDGELLEMRMSNLHLRIEGTPLESRIARLYNELESRGLDFRPHFWLSDEWYSPDGTPGIAAPFYLAHPRLMKLERRQMLEVEGGSEAQCMKILRHEAGHAIDTAFRLHRRQRWRELFGRHTEKYPDYYQPKPYSKDYVLHLDAWYAQSHPSEDFAETFAVWLKPRSKWRVQYEGWPAIEKLHYVDELMTSLAGEKPAVSSRRHVEPLRELNKSLKEHYAEKRERYGSDYPHFYDRDLRKLFSCDPEHARCGSAAAFLRSCRKDMRRLIAQWTGLYQYTIDQVLNEMIERCMQLRLRVHRAEDEVRRDLLVLLTVQTMNYLHQGRRMVL